MKRKLQVGDFVISKDDSILENVPKIVKVEKCTAKCSKCPNNRFFVKICGGRTKLIVNCLSDLELYRGPIKNTVCYNCEDKLYCTIIDKKDVLKLSHKLCLHKKGKYCKL